MTCCADTYLTFRAAKQFFFLRYSVDYWTIRCGTVSIFFFVLRYECSCCISLVEKVIEDVRKKREMHSLEPAKERDCGICFCPIEEDEIHRLESCGHSYCKECVELQFKSAVKNRVNDDQVQHILDQCSF
jgi:hypothetical protein